MSSNDESSRWPGALLFAAVALALLGSLAYLLVVALGGFELVDVIEVRGAPSIVDEVREPLPWLIAALVAAALALGLWQRERMRAGDSLTDEELREQFHQLRQAERNWARDLHQGLRELRASQGPLGRGDEVPSLVLSVAVRLLDAERGLLFSGRTDDGSESKLVATEGYERYEDQPAVAAPFAKLVLDREAIVRRSGDELEAAERDAGIENLIAIPIYLADEFSGAVICLNSSSYGEHDEEVLLALGDHAGAVLENNDLQSELRDSYVATVSMLAEAIRAKDPHLGGHSQDVSKYVARVAEELGLDSRQREELVFASLLHDLGKIGISERILLKPGRLTPEEFGVIQLHPRIGARLVQQVPALAPLALFILHHHERVDGSGYPASLRGEEIPLEARVIGVADAFSAMTSDRPYRGRMTLEAACEELERHAGSQFDRKVVGLFTEEVRRDPPADEDEAKPATLDDLELGAREDASGVLGIGPLEITDHLTLLYSHRYFHEFAEAEAEQARAQDASFAVCLFELEGLERINAEQGYAGGDKAIQDLARAVEQVAVKCGGTAARLSGRRIGLLATATDETAGRGLISEVVTTLGERLRLVGGCAASRAGENGEAVIARARAELDGARDTATTQRTV